MGFVLTEEEAQEMLVADPKNSEVIFPYLNGRELNSHPAQKPSRWVINFWDWSEERAKQYSAPYQWIKKHVYPERLKKSKSKSYRNMMSKWWQHWNIRPGLYHAIGRGFYFENHPDGWEEYVKLDNVLVCSLVSKYFNVALVNSDIVYAHKLAVFATDSPDVFALLSSSVHDVWTRSNSSSLETRLNYSPSDAFETFPQPNNKINLLTIGDEFQFQRHNAMQNFNIGLTNLYNRFHNKDDKEPYLEKLRELQCQLDTAVAAAYGWDDLALDHDFHTVPYLPENDRIRYTISEPARIEVLHRLSLLNRQRYEEEVAQGLHGKQRITRRAASKRVKKAASKQGAEITLQKELFDVPLPAPVRKKYQSRKTYCAFLLMEVLKQWAEKCAHIDQIIAVWAILSDPDAMVRTLKARTDVCKWHENYPDQITIEDSLIGTFENLISRSTIKINRDMIVELIDDSIKIPDHISQDVKLALESVAVLQQHEPREAIEQRRKAFEMINFIEAARQGRYEYATTA